MAHGLAASLLLPAAGCSLVLDFSDRAIPKDAGPDAPYSAAECEYKEPNDSPDTAAPFTPDDTGPAAICAGDAEDHDFYRFTVPPLTAQVALRLDYAFRTTGDLELRLTHTAGVTLSTGFGDVERIVCPGPGLPNPCPTLPAGDYVVEVFPVPGSVNRYTLGLTITK
jgi:hypothetical protein